MIAAEVQLPDLAQLNWYALNFDTGRGGLSPAGQEAYDRLLEQRRSGEAPDPVSLADAEAASRAVRQEARRALAEGRRVFLCRVPAMYDAHSRRHRRAVGPELSNRIA